MFKKLLLWLLKTQLPNITRWILDLFQVDAAVAAIVPIVEMVRAKLPDAYDKQFNELLNKIGQVFVKLSANG